MRLEDDLDIVVSDPNYFQKLAPDVEQEGDSSIKVRIYTLDMPAAPTSYKVIYQRVIDRYNSGGYPSTTINNSTNPKTISGLVPGAMYQIKTQAVGPNSEGNTITVFFKLTGTTVNPSTIKGREDYYDSILSKLEKIDDYESGTIVGTRFNLYEETQASKSVRDISYLRLYGGKSVDNKYTYAYRDFESITIPVSTSSDGLTEYPAGQYYYYGFGTSFVFPPKVVYEPQEAGIGFFLNDKGSSGYYVTFATTRTATAKEHTPIRIFKVKGKQITQLTPSKKSTDKSLATLFAGTQHTLDVKVQVSEDAIIITGYINGYEIKATDKNVDSGVKPNAIVPISKRVALLAASGMVSFDYVYATNLKASEYDSKSAFNPYEGQFSNDYLRGQYGDIVYSFQNDNAREEDLKTSYDEFGAVAREMVRKKVKFGGGAAFPNDWTTGANKRIKILSQDKSHFGAEAFVINNTSTTAPLSDGGVNSFAVIGSTIGFSGDIEYFTDPPSEYAVAEPATFNSYWLQTQEDVESLAYWIKTSIVNKAKTINMTVFGNPLISVGDIITVKYDYQKFTGSSNQKIIVTHVFHRYENGLQTTIKGRTI